ncbi:hypothetical protein PVAP13_9NG542800 [Panicum virgatum]|uniref:Uncharacterized protein n=1 Tax=Panicum virgatum TaxID=38727 RepID=A0A8T0MZN9_PANVG|nr:hypothetical protein PVAP13_9NG542800 [Panicum virgatum]
MCCRRGRARTSMLEVDSAAESLDSPAGGLDSLSPPLLLRREPLPLALSTATVSCCCGFSMGTTEAAGRVCSKECFASSVVTGGVGKRRRRMRVSKYHGATHADEQELGASWKARGHILSSLVDYLIELDGFLSLQRGIIFKFR